MSGSEVSEPKMIEGRSVENEGIMNIQAQKAGYDIYIKRRRNLLRYSHKIPLRCVENKVPPSFSQIASR